MEHKYNLAELSSPPFFRTGPPLPTRLGASRSQALLKPTTPSCRPPSPHTQLQASPTMADESDKKPSPPSGPGPFDPTSIPIKRPGAIKSVHVREHVRVRMRHRHNIPRQGMSTSPGEGLLHVELCCRISSQAHPWPRLSRVRVPMQLHPSQATTSETCHGLSRLWLSLWPWKGKNSFPALLSEG